MTLVLTPVGLYLLLARKSFRRNRTGETMQVGRAQKAVFGVLGGALWAVGLLSVFGGNDLQIAANPSSQAAISACDSPAARDALANAVEQNAASNIDTLRLLDVRERNFPEH